MPRIADPGNVEHQRRQRAYRARLQSRAEPEASDVDTALAAAVAAYAVALDGSKDIAYRRTLKALLRGAIHLLEDKGFDRDHSVAVIRRRLSKEARDDLSNILKRSHIVEIL